MFEAIIPFFALRWSFRASITTQLYTRDTGVSITGWWKVQRSIATESVVRKLRGQRGQFAGAERTDLPRR